MIKAGMMKQAYEEIKAIMGARSASEFLRAARRSDAEALNIPL
jgi:hypothetical protein